MNELVAFVKAAFGLIRGNWKAAAVGALAGILFVNLINVPEQWGAVSLAIVVVLAFAFAKVVK